MISIISMKLTPGGARPTAKSTLPARSFDEWAYTGLQLGGAGSKDVPSTGYNGVVDYHLTVDKVCTHICTPSCTRRSTELYSVQLHL